MVSRVSFRTVLNTAYGCTFMDKEQGSSTHNRQVRGGCGRNREMGQRGGKTLTWLKKTWIGLLDQVDPGL